jgi:hypothetical protein
VIVPAEESGCVSMGSDPTAIGRRTARGVLLTAYPAEAVASSRSVAEGDSQGNQGLADSKFKNRPPKTRFILRPKLSIRPGVGEVGRVIRSSGSRRGKSRIFIGKGAWTRRGWQKVSGVSIYSVPGIFLGRVAEGFWVSSYSVLGIFLPWGEPETDFYIPKAKSPTVPRIKRTTPSNI